jgi:hypothetical protein
MTSTHVVQHVTAYKCQECDEMGAEVCEERLYRCENGCGATFNQANSNNGRNQCPECYKMAQKVADNCCAVCEAGEVEEIDALQCPFCDEVIDGEEFATHLKDEHVDDLAEEFLASVTYEAAK